jgi:putative transposase
MALGRFKSFPIEQDQSLLNVLRYVERNALRTNLLSGAQEWRWYSQWRRVHGDRESLLSDWPFDMPADWVEWVNTAQTEVELEALPKWRQSQDTVRHGKLEDTDRSCARIEI